MTSLVMPKTQDGRAYCTECGEPTKYANTEAWDELDLLLCDDCAERALEDNSQFGVGA